MLIPAPISRSGAAKAGITRTRTVGWSAAGQSPEHAHPTLCPELAKADVSPPAAAPFLTAVRPGARTLVWTRPGQNNEPAPALPHSVAAGAPVRSVTKPPSI
jgi:hypothetical protein